MRRWTKQEDDKLKHLRDVERLPWNEVSERLSGRTSDSCRVRYDRLKADESTFVTLNLERIRRSWSSEETTQLIDLREKEGLGCSEIARRLPARRTAGACYKHYKDLKGSPGRLVGPFTPLEDDMILKAVEQAKMARSPVSWTNVGMLLQRRPKTVYIRWHSLNRDLKKGKWTEDEDLLLTAFVGKARDVGQRPVWVDIAAQLNRSPHIVRRRWTGTLCPELVSCRFTSAEDCQIIDFVTVTKSADCIPWSVIARQLRRPPAQVQQRWNHTLDPALNKRRWTEEDDEALLSRVTAMKEEGRRVAWADIGRILRRPGTFVQIRWKILESRIC